MSAKAKRGFDAVAESRRWKETVAAETAGISSGERMAWFRRQSSVSAIRNQAQPATGELVLREDPPHCGARNAAGTTSGHHVDNGATSSCRAASPNGHQRGNRGKEKSCWLD